VALLRVSYSLRLPRSVPWARMLAVSIRMKPAICNMAMLRGPKLGDKAPLTGTALMESIPTTSTGTNTARTSTVTALKQTPWAVACTTGAVITRDNDVHLFYPLYMGTVEP
jgi:hypothetical protein